MIVQNREILQISSSTVIFNNNNPKTGNMFSWDGGGHVVIVLARDAEAAVIPSTSP